MQVKRIFNNNIILANDVDHEVVIMGRGIGFQKHPKDQVDETKIENIYAPQSKSWLKNFMLLMNDIDPIYFELTDKIISLAMKDLHTKFNEYLLISLTDHIHFAVYRHQHKMDIKNEILWEIKRIYKDEFKVALKAVSLIDKQFNIKLPEDEVGFIAIKFVENRLDNPARKNTEQITDLINGILNIIKYQFRITLDLDDINYRRLVTHLEYFAQRIYSSEEKNSSNETDIFLYQHVIKKYPASFECVKKIVTFVESETNKKVSLNEQAYLTIHIQRILDEISHR